MDGSEESGGVGDGERAFQKNDVGTAESNLSFIKVSCFCPKFGNISILHFPLGFTLAFSQTGEAMASSLAPLSVPGRPSRSVCLPAS